MNRHTNRRFQVSMVAAVIAATVSLGACSDSGSSDKGSSTGATGKGSSTGATPAAGSSGEKFQYCEGQKQIPRGYLCPKGAVVHTSDTDTWTFVSFKHNENAADHSMGLVLTFKYHSTDNAINPSTNAGVPGVRQFTDINAAPASSEDVFTPGLFQQTEATPNTDIKDGAVTIYSDSQDGANMPFNPKTPAYADFVTSPPNDNSGGGFVDVFLPLPN